MSDYKGKITPCCVKIQDIGSGLTAKGKSIVEYNFVGKDGKIVETTYSTLMNFKLSVVLIIVFVQIPFALAQRLIY